MFDGGSVAFWNEIFKPEKHIAIDINQRNDSDYFISYIKSNNLGNKISTFWNVNQSDKETLTNLCSKEFTSSLDLVIDDASHMYSHTKNSFEILFPLLSPGGLYIIEDWAWGHWEDFFSPKHMWAHETVPTKLITELIELCGTDSSIISSVNVYQGFAVIERGVSATIGKDFSIDKYIKRRPKHFPKLNMYQGVKNIAKSILGRK